MHPFIDHIDNVTWYIDNVPWYIEKYYGRVIHLRWCSAVFHFCYRGLCRGSLDWRQHITVRTTHSKTI